MGFIKAFTGALSGTFADQWKEYYKPSLVDTSVVFFPAVAQAQNAGIGENTKGSNNIISNGSKIIVPVGTALITIQDGAITGCITEPGGYIYSSTDPNSRSFFGGDGIISSTLGQTWERFKFGGQAATEQLAFYVNLQGIPVKFGTPTPVSWDDAFLMTQVSAAIRGNYTLKISDPLLFVQQFIPLQYKMPGAPVFDYDAIDEDKNNELFENFTTALPEAFGKYCNDAQGGTRLQSLQRDQLGIAKVLSETVEQHYNWLSRYGFAITNVSLTIEYDEQTMTLLKEAQADDIELRRASRMGQAYSNNMAGMMAAASANAMNAAASNENGAMMGFMGMNIANMQANNMMGAAMNAQQAQQTPGQQQNIEMPQSAQAQPVQEDPYAKLAQLKNLLDQGVITQADFDAAKNKLLGI